MNDARDPSSDRRSAAGQAVRGLEVRSIAKAYDSRAVLHDVSLGVSRGEVVGLLGPNGAGKTTCFYSVMGLVKPDSGPDLPRRRGHHRPADVPPRDPRPWLSAAGNLDLPRPDRRAEHPGRARGRPSPTAGARTARLEQLLDEFGLTALRDAPAMALSGGERRRCEIARALAADPSIMLLDEPFAGIDPISIADIRELVRELKQRDIGVLITDHNVRETLDIVDRACIIYDGQVLFQGTPAGAGRRPGGAPALPRRELRAVAGRPAMALGPRLDIRQTQSLVMTPQLQQAIKLLALSATSSSKRSSPRSWRRTRCSKRAADDEGGAGRRRRSSATDRETGDEAPDPTGSDELIAALGGDDDRAARHGLARGGARHRQLRRCRRRRRGERRRLRLRPARSAARPRWPSICSASCTAPAAPTGALAVAIVNELEETGYLDRPLDDIAEAIGRDARPRPSRRWRWSSRSIRRASARAASPNASRCRPRRPTATTRRWRG